MIFTAWIESHQSLERHPKLLKLASFMGWSKNETIGVLHRLWWWALEYVEDGDLSKYGEEAVRLALDIEADKPFFLRAIECGFLDDDLKIHDWILFSGTFLTRKYHTSNLPLLKKIWAKHGYKYGKGNGKFAHIKGSRKEVERKQKGSLPNLTLPNLTKPNLNTPPYPPGGECKSSFEKFWKAYPKKKSKGQAKKAWFKINPDEQLVAIIIAKIEQAKTSEDWLKEKGQYIPHPATWLNAEGWHDEYTPANTNQQIQGVSYGSGKKRSQADSFFTPSGGIKPPPGKYDNTAIRADADEDTDASPGGSIQEGKPDP